MASTQNISVSPFPPARRSRLPRYRLGPASRSISLSRPEAAQITLNSGRSTELKQRFYKALADHLHEGVKIRKEDVLINFVEVAKENCSFGNGEAQYVTPQK